MASTARLAEIAALLGEPARAAMMQALMDGRALTAGELAQAGGITPQTASAHLARLTGAGLLAMERQGRHRYHRLAGTEVARLLESLMALAEAPARPAIRTGPREAALRHARTCYDHLAGRLGVAITGHLLDTGAVVFDADSAAGDVTDRAAATLERLGMTPEVVAATGPGRRPHCRPCLDWSERRMHLAGRLGALICHHCPDNGWLLRRAGTRALDITPRGAVALRDWLGHTRWREVTGESVSA